ncbi:MAG: TRAP transporter small permease subunit [Amaricoccus sp.]|uniref:TRAP transporter small permease subunit n=1 Tax=Amaricoccus sp. TaxID=1872485 RepID=UPI0033162E92
MSGLLLLAGVIDRITRFFGWIAAWLVLLSCLISAGNAMSRYILSASSNAWLEIQWQMFAGIFLLGAAYVLQVNEHVRVDLFYGSASARRKLWIDVIGIIFFLFPSTIMIGAMAWPFFLSSFQSGEMSSNAGGLPVWPVKFLLPFGMALVFLQGVAELIKRIAALRGEYAVAVEYERPLQ